MKYLLVFPQTDALLAVTLQDELRQELQDRDPTINIAISEIDARRELTSGGYDAVVTAVEIPETRAPGSGTSQALSLLRWMRRDRELKSRVVIVVPAMRADLQGELVELGNCIQISQEDANWIDELRQFIRRGVPAVKPVIITFDFTHQRSGSKPWTYTITSDRAAPKEGQIRAQLAALDGARALSNNVITLPQWERQLSLLGRQLGTLLFHDNAEFKNDLRSVLGSAGAGGAAPSETRVVFKVGPQVYPILLEAVYHPRQNDPSYWMLEAPVIRSLRSDIPPLELWGDKRPPKCLVIEANGAGFYEQLDISASKRITMEPPLVLEELSNAAVECDAVERIFIDLQARELVGEVRRLRPTRDVSMWDQFRQVIRGGWDIIHFAGHSYYHEPEDEPDDPGEGETTVTGNGFIFFPRENPTADAQPIHHASFANWVRNTKLVFISSCRSAGSGFAFALSAASVPVVISYHGDVTDAYAPEFAKTFYTEFLAQRDLPAAFFRSRCKMYQSYKQDRIWVTPTLTVNSAV